MVWLELTCDWLPMSTVPKLKMSTVPKLKPDVQLPALVLDTMRRSFEDVGAALLFTVSIPTRDSLLMRSSTTATGRERRNAPSPF
jgi:hypothetical protein